MTPTTRKLLTLLILALLVSFNAGVIDAYERDRVISGRAAGSEILQGMLHVVAIDEETGEQLDIANLRWGPFHEGDILSVWRRGDRVVEWEKYRVSLPTFGLEDLGNGVWLVSYYTPTPEVLAADQVVTVTRVP